MVDNTADAAEHRARQALTALERAWPDLGAELRITVHRMDGFPAALATLGPQRDYTPPLFDQLAEREQFIFCFGRVTGAGSSAARISQAIATGGISAARQLDGSFAAIVCEPGQQRFRAFTDLVGMWSLRCASAAGTVVLGSHDLALVAAGVASADLDLDSAASLIACDWSLGAKPLISEVRVCGANEIASYERGRLSLDFHPALTLGERVSLRDRAGIANAVSEVAAAFEDAAEEFVPRQPSIRFSLTAGEDSRALMALLTRFPQADLLAQTSGAPESEDVVVARWLAKLVGVPHQLAEQSAPQVESFQAMTRLQAICMNGLTNAKRALTRIPHWEPRRRVLCGGEGGELYTGFLYRSGRGLPARTSVDELASRLVTHRFKRWRSLAITDQEWIERLTRRLVESLGRLASISEDTHDLLDLFYLYERYALWGAYGEHSTWTRRWTPFNNTIAIRRAYRLPPPIGVHCTVHELLIRRHLPLLAYLTPVNGSEFLPLSGAGRLRSLTRRLLKELGKRAPWHTRPQGASQGTTTPSGGAGERARMFRDELGQYLRDLLLSDGSIGLGLLGRAGLERLFDEHRVRLNQLQTLGFLATAETFRQQALALQSASRQVGVNRG